MVMKNPIVVIGLDAADPVLCEAFMEAGHLSNLRALRERGCYVPITSLDYGTAEAGWTAFMSGVNPEKTGFWSQLRFDRENYDVKYVGSYEYDEFPLFYELGGDYRVAAFDIPQSALSDRVNGIQVLGYGAHSQQGPRLSSPADLLPHLIERYGDHPAYNKDKALLWDRAQLEKLTQALITGAERRGKICHDLLAEENWDLFFTVFGELHSGGHFLWHVSQPDHPFHEIYKDIVGVGRDPLLEVMDAVDIAVGEIMDAAPNATFIVFSQEGMVPNNLDLPSLVFLPELMYRHSFPGRMGIAGGPPGDNSPLAPMITKPHSLGWTRALMALKHDDNPIMSYLRRNLPMELSFGAEHLFGNQHSPAFPGWPFSRNSITAPAPHWMGPLWYRRDWPQMKAFALPSFSDGYICINLKGRDHHGTVDPENYDALCDELASLIGELRNARTGQRLARKVIRTRASVTAEDGKHSDADLVVKWVDEPADIVDSLALGRIGPVPHRRSGGHNSNCFAVVAGPGIEPGSTLPGASLLDLPPTILDMLEAPIPTRFDGTSLWPTMTSR